MDNKILDKWQSIYNSLSKEDNIENRALNKQAEINNYKDLNILSIVDGDTIKVMNPSSGLPENIRLHSDIGMLDTAEKVNNTEDYLNKLGFNIHKSGQLSAIANMNEVDTQNVSIDMINNVANYQQNALLDKLQGLDIQPYNKNKLYELRDVPQGLKIKGKQVGTDYYNRPLYDLIDNKTNKSLLDDLVENSNINSGSGIKYNQEDYKTYGTTDDIITRVTDGVQSSIYGFVGRMLSSVMSDSVRNNLIQGANNFGISSILLAGDIKKGQEYSDIFAGLSKETREYSNLLNQKSLEAFENGDIGSAIWNAAKNLDMLLADSSANMLAVTGTSMLGPLGVTSGIIANAADLTIQTNNDHINNTGKPLTPEEALNTFSGFIATSAIESTILSRGIERVLPKGSKGSITSKLLGITESTISEGIQETLENSVQSYYGNDKRGLKAYLDSLTSTETLHSGLVGGLMGGTMSSIGTGAKTVLEPLVQAADNKLKEYQENTNNNKESIKEGTLEYYQEELKNAGELYKSNRLDKDSQQYKDSAKVIHSIIANFRDKNPDTPMDTLIENSGLTKAEIVEALQLSALGSSNANITEEQKETIRKDLNKLDIESIYSDLATATNEKGKLILNEELDDLVSLEQNKDNNEVLKITLEDVDRRFNNKSKKLEAIANALEATTKTDDKVKSKPVQITTRQNGELKSYTQSYTFSKDRFKNTSNTLKFALAIAEEASILKKYNEHLKSNNHITEDKFSKQDENNINRILSTLNTLTKGTRNNKLLQDTISKINSILNVEPSRIDSKTQKSKIDIDTQKENKKSLEANLETPGTITEQSDDIFLSNLEKELRSRDEFNQYKLSTEEKDEELLDKLSKYKNTVQVKKLKLKINTIRKNSNEYIRKLTSLANTLENTEKYNEFTQDEYNNFLTNLEYKKETAEIKSLIKRFKEFKNKAKDLKKEITKSEIKKEELKQTEKLINKEFKEIQIITEVEESVTTDENLDTNVDINNELDNIIEQEESTFIIEVKEPLNDFKDGINDNIINRFIKIITNKNYLEKSNISKNIRDVLSTLVNSIFNNNITEENIKNIIDRLNKGEENLSKERNEYKIDTLHNLSIISRILENLERIEVANKGQNLFSQDFSKFSELLYLKKLIKDTKSSVTKYKCRKQINNIKKSFSEEFNKLTKIQQEVVIKSYEVSIKASSLINSLFKNLISSSSIKTLNLANIDSKFDLKEVFSTKTAPKSIFSVIDIRNNDFARYVNSKINRLAKIMSLDRMDNKRTGVSEVIKGHSMNPMVYLFKNKDKKPNLNSMAIVLDTIYDFMKNSSTTYFGTNADNLSKIYNNITNNSLNNTNSRIILDKYGVPIPNLVNSLGKIAMDKFGFTSNENGKFTDYEAMQSLLGSICYQFAIDQGVFNIPIKTKDKKLILDDNTSILLEYDMYFVKLNPNRYNKQGLLSTYENYINMFFNGNTNIETNINNLPSTMPIHSTKETYFSKLKSWLYSSTVNTLFNIYRKTPFYINVDAIKLIEQNIDVIKKYYDFVPAEEIKYLPYDEQISVAGYFDKDGIYDKPFTGKNGQIERSIQNLIDGKNTFKGNDIYFDWNVGSNGRITMKGYTISPQADKLHRMLVTTKNVITNIKFNDNKNMNYFYYALASAFDNLGSTEHITDFGKSLLEVNFDDIYKAFKNGTIEKFEFKSVANPDTSYNLEFESIGHLIAAIDTLQKYHDAKNSNKDSFVCTLGVENDATASGYMVRTMNYPTKLGLHYGKALGIYNKKLYPEDATVKSIKELRKEKDIYELVASNGYVDENGLENINLFGELAEEGSLTNIIFTNLTPLLPIVGKDGKVSKLLRKFAKPAVMIFGYSAGREKIMQGITESIISSIVKDFINKKKSTKELENFFNTIKDNLTVKVNNKYYKIKSIESFRKVLRNKSLDEIYFIGKRNNTGDNTAYLYYNGNTLNKVLTDFIMNTYTTSIYKNLDEMFKEYTEVNKAINTYTSTSTDNLSEPFQRFYESLVKEGKTVKEAKKLLSEAYSLFLPRLASPLGNDNGTSVPLLKTKFMSNSNISENRGVYWKVSSKPNGMNSYYYTDTVPEVNIPTSIAAASAVDSIHSLDASILIRSLLKFKNKFKHLPLSIHDAILTSVKDFSYMAGLYNTEIVETSKKFSILQGIIDNANKVENNISDVINNPDKYDSSIVELAKAIRNINTDTRTESVYNNKFDIPINQRKVINGDNNNIINTIKINGYKTNKDYTVIKSIKLDNKVTSTKVDINNLSSKEISDLLKQNLTIFITPEVSKSLIESYSSIYENTRNDFYNTNKYKDYIYTNMDNFGNGNAVYTNNSNITKIEEEFNKLDISSINNDISLDNEQVSEIKEEATKLGMKEYNSYSKYSIDTNNLDKWAEFASTNTQAVLNILNDCFVKDNTPIKLQNIYKELISLFNLKSLEGVKVLLKKRNDIEGAVGKYDSVENNIVINTNFNKTNFNTATNLSTAEVYMHELIHALTTAVIENANSLAYNNLIKRLNYLMEKVQDKLDYTAFLPNNNNSQEAINFAKQQWDYIFSNKDSTKQLAEFTAMSLTNPNFREVLSKLEYKRIKEPKSILQLITDVFKNLVKFFRNEGKFYDIFPNLDQIINGEKQLSQKENNVLEAIQNLVVDITKANAKALNKVGEKFGVFNTMLDILSIAGNKGNNVIKSLATRLFNNKLINKLDLQPYNKDWNKFKKALWWTKLFTGNFIVPTTRKKIMYMLYMAKMKPEGFWGSLIKQISKKDSLDKFIQGIRLMLNNKDRIAQATYSATIDRLNIIFKNNNLSESDKISLYKGALRTDISSLLNNYSIDNIKEFISNPDKLNEEITKLKDLLIQSYNNERISNEAIGLANILASYMVTGVGYEYMFYNAKQIAKAVSSKVDMTNEIDILVTLLALSKTSNEHLNVLNKLNNNSFKEFLDFHNSFKEELKNKLYKSENDEIKGYTKEETENNNIIVSKIVNKDELIKEGYVLFKEIKFNINGEKLGLYIDTNPNRLSINGGAFSLQSFKPKGISINNILHDINSINGDINQIDLDNDKETVKAKTSKSRMLFKNILQEEGMNAISYIAKNSNSIIPTYNDVGKPIGYRFVLPNDIKETELGMNVNGFDVFANMFKSMYYEYESIESNLSLLNALMINSDEAIKKYPNTFKSETLRSIEYYELSPNSESEYIREQYKYLPRYIKEAIAKHNRPIYVRKDKVPSLLGIREISWAEAKWINRSDVLRKYAKPVIRELEDLMKTITSIAAGNIVIKTIEVISGNLIGNIFTLIGEGYRLDKILKYMVSSIRNVRSYMKIENELNKLETKIKSNSYTQKDLERRQLLIQKLKTNPEYELINAGLWQTIVEDVDLNEKLPSLGKLNNIIEKKIKLPSILKSVVKTLYVTEDTKIYKMLTLLTQFGDYSARSAMYKLEMEKSPHKKGTINYEKYNKKILAKAVDTFVNYDDPASAFQNYVNKLGLVMFVKFFLRIQPIVRRLLWEKPFTFIASTLVSIFTGFWNDSLLYQVPLLGRNVLNLFHNPIDLLINAVTPGLAHLLGHAPY